MLVLFALAMFMMLTRSRENYSGEKNIGYAVAKTLLGLYVGGRRGVCAISGDSKNVDVAVDIIYNQAARMHGMKGGKCPPELKGSAWKAQMNKAIDNINLRQGRPFGGVKVILNSERKLLISGVEKFAKDCDKNKGNFTKSMIRDQILGFRKVMCSKKYYNKPSRFINRAHITKMRQGIAAGGVGGRGREMEASSGGGRLTMRGDRFIVDGVEIEDPRAGARGPNGETWCAYMKEGKCMKWDDADNAKLGIGMMQNTPIYSNQAARDAMGGGKQADNDW